MKSIFSVFMAACLLMGLTACGNAGENEPSVSQGIGTEKITAGQNETAALADGTQETEQTEAENEKANEPDKPSDAMLIDGRDYSSGMVEIVYGDVESNTDYYIQNFTVKNLCDFPVYLWEYPMVPGEVLELAHALDLDEDSYDPVFNFYDENGVETYKYYHVTLDHSGDTVSSHAELIADLFFPGKPEELKAGDVICESGGIQLIVDGYEVLNKELSPERADLEILYRIVNPTDNTVCDYNGSVAAEPNSTAEYAYRVETEFLETTIDGEMVANFEEYIFNSEQKCVGVMLGRVLIPDSWFEEKDAANEFLENDKVDETYDLILVDDGRVRIVLRDAHGKKSGRVTLQLEVSGADGHAVYDAVSRTNMLSGAQMPLVIRAGYSEQGYMFSLDLYDLDNYINIGKSAVEDPSFVGMNAETAKAVGKIEYIDTSYPGEWLEYRAENIFRGTITVSRDNPPAVMVVSEGD